jgi:hypothetical protein
MRRDRRVPAGACGWGNTTLEGFVLDPASTMFLRIPSAGVKDKTVPAESSIKNLLFESSRGYVEEKKESGKFRPLYSHR